MKVVRSTATSSPNDTHATTSVTRKNGATRSIVRTGEAHILAYHHLSYGVHIIRAPIPANTPTKKPMAMAISMITSWVDGGFDSGFL